MTKEDTLGQRIRIIRRRHRLTQEKFGELLKVGKSSIINYESGKRTPDAKFLAIMVEKFKVDAGWLLMGGNWISNGCPNLDDQDEKVQKMIGHLRIPTIKLLMLAEYNRVSTIFQDLIDEFDQGKG
jgi:transcriptional regulator with XRE-family HTH domain